MTLSRRGLMAFGRRGPPEVVVVVCLRGEHDLSTVAESSVTMARAITLGKGDLVVDLSRVAFMDASTVAVILETREVLRARSRSLVLRSPSRCARRVLELCDLGHLVAPGRAEAPMAGAAAALGTWVTVPAIDGLDRTAEVSAFDSLPETVFAERVSATRAAPSREVHPRAVEHPTGVTGSG
jgi:anti-anti-sigma factor